MTMRKTKIICTLGPSTDDPAVLRELMLSGMDVARINMSHQDHDAHRARIDRVRALREELRLPIAILIDTKGPEIRLGTFPEKVTLKAGDTFTLTTVPAEGTAERAFISFAGLPGDVDKGSHILIDDGLVELLVDRYFTGAISLTWSVYALVPLLGLGAAFRLVERKKKLKETIIKRLFV